MARDPDKVRAVQLGYKRSTQGLSEQEEKELEELNKRMAMQNRMQMLKPEGSAG